MHRHTRLLGRLSNNKEAEVAIVEVAMAVNEVVPVVALLVAGSLLVEVVLLEVVVEAHAAEDKVTPPPPFPVSIPVCIRAALALVPINAM